MAFVTGLSVGAFRGTTLSHSALTGAPVSSVCSTSSPTTPRMGYGDYSYQTDRTKGHVQQYYVDKFRVASDFAKGPPKSIDDAVLGRDIKGGVRVPSEGIPQQFDPALPTSNEPTAPDPRLAEASGSVYRWDIAYENPAYAKDTFADLDDEDVAENAFIAFRGSLAQERGAALTKMDFGAQARVKRIREGLDESYLLCLDGSLDLSYARTEKIANPPAFTPYGQPQTEIPGTPYLGSIGAMDFQKKPGDSIAFWKTDVPTTERAYKKPSGNETPELPYNKSPSVEELKEAQAARGLLPESK